MSQPSLGNTQKSSHGKQFGQSGQLGQSGKAGSSPALPAVRPAAGAMGGLRDAVTAALDYSTEVRGARTAVAAADADVEVARSGYYPSLQSEAGVGSGTHDYGLTLSQPLYDWGRTSAQVSGAQSGRSAAFVEFSAQREQVMLNAASAYIAVARATALEQVAADELKAYRRIAGLAGQRTAGGYGDATEAGLAELHVDRAQSALEEARGKVRDARSVFASRVGREPGKLAAVPELSATLKTALRLSGSKVAGAASLTDRTDQSPTVKAALARAKTADATAAAEKAQLFPTLSAEAYVRGNDSSDDDLKNGIGLRLTGPTFTGLSNFKRVEAARLLADQERWNAETSRRDVLRQVQAFLDQEPTLRARQTLLKQQRTKALHLRDLYEDQFKASNRTLSDLVTVQSDVTEIESGLINARFDLYDLQYNAAGALGLLGDLLAITPVSDAGTALSNDGAARSGSQKGLSRPKADRACNTCKLPKKTGHR
ncbi:TolC family protein [Phyllobacterium phragmitis]|uniref:TolC family protein n=1 Tax=Phyllobacterium phragmitis TaxID=2670329 RepID=UPI0013048B5E|nr:TolC family protein [Phyllobacterium phragmitis]